MRLAIFGSPVAHSLSPAMHRAALAHVGLAGDYTAREVDERGFTAGMREIRAGTLDGANVTMPYKRLAYEVADRLSERARQVGAVNTLWLAGEELRGDNTDVDGVDYAFTAAGLSRDDAVIVLGAGGAAAAAQVALAGRELHVVARNPDAAAALVARTGSTARVIPWGDPIPQGILVNATALGMRGEILPDDMLGAATGLLDMAYADTPTRSVMAMQDRGVPVADGLDMLVGQAVGCFEIWSGRQVPALVFRHAAEAELESRAGGTAS